ncbi:S-formylglutathione hydrolase FrmB [Paenibacillus shirakamiensis]|uniref:S-formylglutathione hydrolase FrmB n=1 Tax=Paenibacillus shirakamiensis TaxID=1265935 RepID=A0ABS4JH14_9BACL|nr:alpha/beta hydrolase family protein [Paenibacillus shirakamiensis]MBP2001007.1 S-formylglutathione hydrolase FrmB [Paenibacillus shirakamiensis]
MALMQCKFHSQVLGLNTSMTVILPEPAGAQIGMPVHNRKGNLPTLYLLHGLSDDDSTWIRRSSIERYVAQMGIAVVMPQVFRSFYTDMAYGGKYWTFISEELPVIARSFFPLSEAREDQFVAGLSMGGYGAFKLALRHPDRYAAAASLSGSLEIEFIRDREPELYHQIFGDHAVLGTDNDLFYLLDQLGQAKKVPQLYQACGTEDFLYQSNTNFRDHARQYNLNLTYCEGSGEHNWEYWDTQIQEVLRWLPIRSVSTL